MYLAKGTFDGRAVLSEADVIAMQTPQMVTPAPLLFPEISHTSYGMGLFVFLERDQKARAAEADAKAKGYTPRKAGTQPSHDLGDYVGDYEHPGYGLLKIGRNGDDLTVTYNKASSTLKHFHYDVFEVPANALDRLERTKVMFDTGGGGEISGLAICLELQVKDIAFARVADRSMRDRAFLESLAGTYEVGPNLARVTLRGDGVLVLAMPGQPVRELEPVSGTTFAVKGLSGYKMEFKKDESGRITEAAFHQPGTTLLAKRTQ